MDHGHGGGLKKQTSSADAVGVAVADTDAVDADVTAVVHVAVVVGGDAGQSGVGQVQMGVETWNVGPLVVDGS